MLLKYIYNANQINGFPTFFSTYVARMISFLPSSPLIVDSTCSQLSHIAKLSAHTALELKLSY